MLQLKKDLLSSVFGQERATALLEEVATSVRDRDLLHNSLLQRKSKLQVSVGGPPSMRAWPQGWGRPSGQWATLQPQLSPTACHCAALGISFCPPQSQASHLYNLGRITV